MPLQNNDILLVNRNGNSHRYSFENLKRDVLSDIELQLDGLEWVTALPNRADRISGLPNVAATPRDWDSVTTLLIGAGNDISNITVGSALILTNQTSGNSGTYSVSAIDVGNVSITVTYISDTGGDIQEGNTFAIAVLEPAVQYWTRDEATDTLSPVNENDNVDLGTGDLSAAAGTFSGDVGIGGTTADPSILLRDNGYGQGSRWIVGGNPGSGGGAREAASIENIADAGANVRVWKNTEFSGSSASADNTFLQFWSSPAANTARTQKVNWTSDGSLLIGGTLPGTPNIQLLAQGYIEANRAVTGVSGVAVFQGTQGELQVMGNGDCQNTTGTYRQISDVSLKENIVEARSQWDDIKSLRVVNFNFKEETGYETKKQIGFVAQEVEAVSPGLVNEDEDGIKSVATSIINVKAVKALQEALTRIEALEAEVQALKGG